MASPKRRGPLTIRKYKNGVGITVRVMNGNGESVGLASWGVDLLAGGYHSTASAYGPEWTKEQSERYASLEAVGASTYPPPCIESRDLWHFGSTTNGRCNQRVDAVSRARAEFKNAIAWLEQRLGVTLKWKSAKY